jgi:superfamily II DNA/RNA helicase
MSNTFDSYDAALGHGNTDTLEQVSNNASLEERADHYLRRTHKRMLENADRLHDDVARGKKPRNLRTDVVGDDVSADVWQEIYRLFLSYLPSADKMRAICEENIREVQASIQSESESESVLDAATSIQEWAQYDRVVANILNGVCLDEHVENADDGEEEEEEEQVIVPPNVSVLDTFTKLFDDAGLAELIKDAFCGGIERLYRWQHECALGMTAMCDESTSLVLSVPTGNGKTMVLMMAALHCVLVRKKSVIVVAPYRALVSELTARLHPLGVALNVCVAEYQAGKGAIPGPSYLRRICVGTPERLAGLVRALRRNPYNRLADEFGLVIVDEVHLIADETRGSVLERLICELRACHIKTIAMSGTLPNVEQLAAWLGGGQHYVVSRSERMVALDIGTVDSRQFRKAAMALLRNLFADGGVFAVDRGVKLLMFCPTKNDCTRWRELYKRHFASKGGSAFEHHADLSEQDREGVEAAFRVCAGAAVIFCTTSLAAGVNLPADGIVLAPPYSMNYTVGWFGYVKPSQFQQMAGRAGRPQDGGTESGGTVRIVYPRDNVVLRNRVDSWIAGPDDVVSGALVRGNDKEALELMTLLLLDALCAPASGATADVKRVASRCFRSRGDAARMSAVAERADVERYVRSSFIGWLREQRGGGAVDLAAIAVHANRNGSLIEFGVERGTERSFVFATNSALAMQSLSRVSSTQAVAILKLAAQRTMPCTAERYIAKCIMPLCVNTFRQCEDHIAKSRDNALGRKLDEVASASPCGSSLCIPAADNSAGVSRSARPSRHVGDVRLSSASKNRKAALRLGWASLIMQVVHAAKTLEEAVCVSGLTVPLFRALQDDVALALLNVAHAAEAYGHTVTIDGVGSLARLVNAGTSDKVIEKLQQRLSNVGAPRARALAKAGFTSVQRIAQSSAEQIMAQMRERDTDVRHLRFTVSVLERIVESARTLCGLNRQ